MKNNVFTRYKTHICTTLKHFLKSSITASAYRLKLGSHFPRVRNNVSKFFFNMSFLLDANWKAHRLSLLLAATF